MLYRYASACALLSYVCTTFAFTPVKDYSGSTFFDDWDFFGSWDNLTLGDVWWLNASDAFNQKLAYVNPAGNAIIRVDNTTNVPMNEKRNTVRITTKDYYSVGSLWIIDLLHIPYGCSVWPAFWAKGPLWPDDGEIDIIEGINVMPNNQMALHTTGGCIHNPPPDQKGRNLEMDCATPAGCTVAETAPNSFNAGFAAAGGGVWATQFDVSGVYIWFWSRPNVPASIAGSNANSPIDISQWGPPSAGFPAGPNCNLTNYFTAQQLVLDITLCGDWAGIGPAYNNSCGHSGPTGTCYADNVVGPGSPRYDNAYFEIKYVRAYTTGQPAPTPTGAATTAAATATVTSGSAEFSDPAGTSTATRSPGSNASTSSGDRAAVFGWMLTILLAFGTSFAVLV